MSVKYLQIYHAIREKILSNEYAINQQLPDEITLTKEFNSSRMTVKKALDLLVSAKVPLSSLAARLSENLSFQNAILKDLRKFLRIHTLLLNPKLFILN